jgi:hypothetical protein
LAQKGAIYGPQRLSNTVKTPKSQTYRQSKPTMPPSESTNDIIAGSLRILAQLVPVAGSAVAQAWSEYEAIRQKQRTEEFFDQLREHMAVLERQHSDLRQKIESMPDAAELMEIAIAAAKRETSETKRAVFSRLYGNFLASPTGTTPSERLDLIHHVEQLNNADLQLLQRFSAGSGILRGDMITGTTMPQWRQLGGPRESDSAWLEQHGPLVHSVAKLQARGLIHEAMYDAFFSSDSTPNSFDGFRRRAWTITPMGRKLLQSVRPISPTAH